MYLDNGQARELYEDFLETDNNPISFDVWKYNNKDVYEFEDDE